MEIIRASRYAGFCGGVKRAWKLAVQEASAGDGPVLISGKLIHNTPAMQQLEGMGVRELNVLEAGDIEPGTPFILRAHGEGPAVYRRANELGLQLIDGTCGIVRNVQKKARELESQGFQVVLYGHRNHPEAKATVAHTEHGMIIESVEEAMALPFFPRIAAIAQTTSSSREYVEVCRVLKEKCDHFENQGHICDFTRRSQEEAADLAGKVDAMVVVGGRDSSNTRRLVEVCSERCRTYHVETSGELRSEWFVGTGKVGVTAGASTRDDDIDAVIACLEEMGR